MTCSGSPRWKLADPGSQERSRCWHRAPGVWSSASLLLPTSPSSRGLCSPHPTEQGDQQCTRDRVSVTVILSRLPPPSLSRPSGQGSKEPEGALGELRLLLTCPPHRTQEQIRPEGLLHPLWPLPSPGPAHQPGLCHVHPPSALRCMGPGPVVPRAPPQPFSSMPHPPGGKTAESRSGAVGHGFSDA